MGGSLAVPRMPSVPKSFRPLVSSFVVDGLIGLLAVVIASGAPAP